LRRCTVKDDSRLVAAHRKTGEISRRRLLKILAASGGAVAASAVLPARWLKPVVDMGVLPAHAQLSNTNPTISNLRTRPANSFYVNFDFNDPLGNVTGEARLSAWLRGNSCKTDPEPYQLKNMVRFVDLKVLLSASKAVPLGQGSVEFTTSVDGGCDPCNSEIQIQISVDGRLSNKSAWVPVNDCPA